MPTTPAGKSVPVTDDRLVRRLLEEAGTTYADEAGIGLADKPMPLFQLLTLCMLASKPIDATIAMRAARELFRTGLRTPQSVLEADRAKMISAFGRAHYVRHDEGSATRLADIAHLRQLAARSNAKLAAALVRVSLDDDLGDKVLQPQ